MTLDLVETFEQRFFETFPELAQRYELMNDFVLNGPVAHKFRISGNKQLVAALDLYREAVTSLEQSALARVHSATVVDYADHRNQLLKMVAGNSRVVLVAHSQGNLFANHVFEGLAKPLQTKVTVLHVAPASARLHGDYLLSDLDLIIAPLAAVDTRLPSVVLSWRESRVSQVSDSTGHGFSEIYLNSDLPFVKRVVAAVDGKDSENDAGEAGIFGVYRWLGSSTMVGFKGSAALKISMKGRAGVWSAGDVCSGLVDLKPSGAREWRAHIETKKGLCVAKYDFKVVALDGQASRVAMLPVGVPVWLVDLLVPVANSLGAKGDNLLRCEG